MTALESHASIVRTRTRGGLLARVSGIIDETFSADDLVTGATGIMVIDLDGVQRITSFGIRAWIQALQRLRTDYYCLINCQPNIVSQLNLVTGFAAKGEVVSFYAPYFCPGCDDSTSVLLDLRRADHRHAVATLELPPVSCPSCGQACELDDMPDLYFQYFRATPLPNPPVLANALIDGRQSGQSFVIEKQIADTITGLWMSGIMDRPGYFRRLADGLQGHVVVVTADVDRVTDRGLKAFRSFLRAAEGALYLARVSPSLLVALAKAPDGLGAARVVSVMLPFYCERCTRAVPIEVPAPVLQSPSWPTAFEGWCPDCSHRAHAQPRSDAAEAARALPLSEAPPQVQTYLTARPRSPTPVVSETGGQTALEPLGKYRIQRFLGSGGMGEVYLARQLGPAGFEKQIVIKRIRTDRLADTVAVDLFLQEAKLSARLSHPNLVQIFDFGQLDDGYFIAMEYVDGPDIKSLLALCRSLQVEVPIELCCRIISDVCQGLHAAHHHRDASGRERPIIHRDVTPGNVLISSDGVVKLTDFGIAKATDSGQETQPGMLKGTIRFIAPEVLRNPKQSGLRPSVDIYGAGVLLYECLVGRPLFEGEGWAGTLQAVLEQPMPRLSQHRAGISPHLERTFQRAVERDPAQRYQDVRDLQLDLHAAIDELGRPATSNDLATWLRAMRARRDASQHSGRASRPGTGSDLEHEATAVDLAHDGTARGSKAGSQ